MEPYKCKCVEPDGATLSHHLTDGDNKKLVHVFEPYAEQECPENGGRA